MHAIDPLTDELSVKVAELLCTTNEPWLQIKDIAVGACDLSSDASVPSPLAAKLRLRLGKLILEGYVRKKGARSTTIYIPTPKLFEEFH